MPRWHAERPLGDRRFDAMSFCAVCADILHQKMTETCASAHIGGVNIVLLEGITPDIQYVDPPPSCCHHFNC